MTKAADQANPLDSYRGHAKLAVIRDLAMGEWSNREIAEQLGVRICDVAEFAAMYADEISEVKAALQGKLAIETAGLWIAKRQNRLAELQSDFEGTSKALRELAQYSPGSRGHLGILRERRSILQAASSEFSAGRGRSDPGSSEPENTVHYVLDFGGSIEDLT